MAGKSESVNADSLVRVVVTGSGTLGPGGIEKVGSEHTIPVRLFSARWMAPVTKADSRIVDEWMAVNKHDP